MSETLDTIGIRAGLQARLGRGGVVPVVVVGGSGFGQAHEQNWCLARVLSVRRERSPWLAPFGREPECDHADDEEKDASDAR
jgi:hypothetical protein